MRKLAVLSGLSDDPGGSLRSPGHIRLWLCTRALRLFLGRPGLRLLRLVGTF
jgi:hypothetical protein